MPLATGKRMRGSRRGGTQQSSTDSPTGTRAESAASVSQRSPASLRFASSEASRNLGQRLVMANGAEDLQIRECRAWTNPVPRGLSRTRKFRMQGSPPLLGPHLLCAGSAHLGVGRRLLARADLRDARDPRIPRLSLLARGCPCDNKGRSLTNAVTSVGYDCSTPHRSRPPRGRFAQRPIARAVLKVGRQPRSADVLSHCEDPTARAGAVPLRPKRYDVLARNELARVPRRLLLAWQSSHDAVMPAKATKQKTCGPVASLEPALFLGDPDRLDAVAGACFGDRRRQVVANGSV